MVLVSVPILPNDCGAAKKKLRKEMRSVRAAALSRLGNEAELRLASMGLSFVGVYPPAWVSGFLPIHEELNPTPLLMRLFQEGYGLCLPVMESKNQPLRFRSWKPGDLLQEVVWGIREPLPNAPTVEPDIVLGPLLAFDRAGHRLGYGGGFYDRTLRRLRSIKPVVAVGLGLDEQRVDWVPHAHHDEILNWVLTPSGPMECDL